MENDNHEKYGGTRNTGRRGLQGEAKTKSLLWLHSIGIRGATLLEYKILQYIYVSCLLYAHNNYHRFDFNCITLLSVSSLSCEESQGIFG